MRPRAKLSMPWPTFQEPITPTCSSKRHACMTPPLPVHTLVILVLTG